MSSYFIHHDGLPSRSAVAGLRACALASLFALAASPAGAENLTWIGGDGAWEDATKWSGGLLPTDQDFVEISPAPIITSTAASNVAEEFLSHAALAIDAGLLTVIGTLDTYGVVTVAAGAALDAGRIFTQAGGGLSVSGGSVEVIEGVFSAGELVLDDGASLAAESFDNFNQWFVRGGASAAANSMINHPGALLRIENATSQLSINGNLTNRGRLEADAAVVMIDSIDNTGALAFSAAAKVTGQSVKSTGEIELSGNGSSWSLASLSIEQGSARIADQATATTGALINQALVTIDQATLDGNDLDNQVGGSVSLVHGALVDMSNEILNRGTLFVDATSELGGASFLQLGGATTLVGGTLAATSALGASIAAGALQGFGVIAGDLRVLDDGTLSPGAPGGDPTARFDISGDLLLDGDYIVEIGGLLETDYDRIVASGNASLGGRLTVSLIDGYLPVVGDFFDIVVAGQVGGGFVSLDLPNPGAGLRFDTITGTGYYRLAISAVPLPAALPLFALAAGLLAAASPSRRARSNRRPR